MLATQLDVLLAVDTRLATLLPSWPIHRTGLVWESKASEPYHATRLLASPEGDFAGFGQGFRVEERSWLVQIDSIYPRTLARPGVLFARAEGVRRLFWEALAQDPANRLLKLDNGVELEVRREPKLSPMMRHSDSHDFIAVTIKLVETRADT